MSTSPGHVAANGQDIVAQDLGAHDLILILDFGSQYTQVIARRIRECGVYSQIYPFATSARVLKRDGVDGIVLSGGPASVSGRTPANSPS